jgi:hypothetical protein
MSLLSVGSMNRVSNGVRRTTRDPEADQLLVPVAQAVGFRLQDLHALLPDGRILHRKLNFSAARQEVGSPYQFLIHGSRPFVA